MVECTRAGDGVARARAASEANGGDPGCIAGERWPGRGPSMGVYVDDAIWGWRGLKWAHLLADDLDELHRFATRLGIHRVSYQGPPRTAVPHYDLTSYERKRAIALGASAVSRHEMVIVLRRVRAARDLLDRAR
jgi:hypothetical protein